MKILIASDTYYPHVNGASYFTQRLAQWLVQHGHEVRVVAPSPEFAQKNYAQAGVEIIGVPSFSLLIHQNFRAAVPWGLKRFLREVIYHFSPDVVHLQDHFMIGRAMARVAKEQGVPLVATNHFMPENLLHYFPVPAKLRGWAQKLAWGDFDKVFRQADVVTTPTKTAANLLKQVQLGKEVRVLSCGIDRNTFQPRAAREDLRQKWNLGGGPYLLYVGRLDQEKNIDLILRALSNIPSEKRPTFLIAGRGAEELNLKGLVQRLYLEQSVRFLGFVSNEDLPGLYNLAQAFVIAGTAELQSLVTLEAMASGLPIIGVNAMALPELVHSGKNGYLFAKGSEVELAQVIEKLMSNEALRKTMGKESLEIVKMHDLDAMGRAYEEIYSRLV